MGRTLKKAIILAAGRGTRLRRLLKGNPKPLLDIGNISLIENLIQKLRKINIKKIIVVTGYQSKKIKKTLGTNVKYIHYPNFKKTNNLHTMLFIKKELNEPLLCLFSDVIFDIKILEKLKKNKKDIVLAIDKKTKLPGTMRVIIKKNLIHEIGSHISPKYCDGNFIGFAKFSNYGNYLLKKKLQKYKKSNFNDYYTIAFNSLIKLNKKINFLNVSRYNWKEIDTQKDYLEAKKIFKRIQKNEKK